MPSLSLTIDLHLNYIPYVKILSQLFNALIFLYNAWDTYIQGTVHSILLVVLNKCLNYRPILNLWDVLYMSVDKCISLAIRSIPHDFLKHSHFLHVLLTILIESVIKLKLAVFFLQLLVYHRQVAYILSSIVYHILGQGSSLPKHIIVSHLSTYFMFLSMNYIYVLLEQIS